MPEKVLVSGAAAIHNLSPGIDKPEGFNVLHERLESKSTAMGIGAEGTTEAKLVRARLFLGESPGFDGVFLAFLQIAKDLRPLNSSFHFKETLLLVEIQDLVHTGRIHQPRGCTKLLATHGMASAAHRECVPSAQKSLDGFRAVGADDAGDMRPVQFGVGVFDPFAAGDA